MERKRLIEEILEKCGQVRQARPLVHMIPSYVTAAFCADAISAVGARPLMAQAAEEMEEITPTAGALAVNLGQPSEEKYQACRLALLAAASHKIPVALDPVGAGASGYRRSIAAGLLELPWSGVIKGNASELHTILTGAMARNGVDSVGSFSHEEEMGRFLQKMAGSGRRLVTAETGAVDKICWIGTDGGKVEKLCLSHERERQMVLVGTGCVAGAILGALLAAENQSRGEPDTRTMAVLAAAAISLVSYCGDRLAVAGYGSYKTGLLDALSSVTEAEYKRYLERNMEMEQKD